MKEEKEVQTAWEIWNLIHQLNDLLFDRYEEDFFHLWLEEGEEEDPSLQPLGVPDIKRQRKEKTRIRTDPLQIICNPNTKPGREDTPDVLPALLAQPKTNPRP